MIGKDEIEVKAREFQIHPANVQRDYIFGWLLCSLFTRSPLRDRVFLKGGNALRKAYFANTRFSGDLDFGTPGEITQAEVLQAFSAICSDIEARSGVKFFPDDHRIAEWYPRTEHQVLNLRVYDVRLYFRDFYGNADHIKIRVSIDFTRYDKVILPLQNRTLIHPYSDASSLTCTLRCMKLEEIIATKLKCLLQRQHAPDLFDYVFTIKSFGGDINRRELATTFIRKTIFGRNPHFVKELLLKTPFDYLRSVWEEAIVCAKSAAIKVEEALSLYVNEIRSLFEVFPSRAPAAFEYFGPHLRNPIMEAGRKQTCLQLTYDSRIRLVEPYSLKYMQRKDGIEREYLYVYDRVGGGSGPGPKSLVASKMADVSVTDIKFEPRWPVELSKSAELPANHYFFDPSRPAKAPNTRKPRVGVCFIYKCPSCGKVFKRTKMDPHLNKHQNKSGRECWGTHGIYVGTRNT